jgi:hypothetical protein
VPIISVFFGIVVRMFYREHEPAHFHAEHQGQQGKFNLDGEMIVGNIQSGTALRSSGIGRHSIGEISRATGRR